VTRPAAVALVFAECLRSACEEPVMSWFGSPFCGLACRDAHHREHPPARRVWIGFDGAGGPLVMATARADGTTHLALIHPGTASQPAPASQPDQIDPIDQPAPASQPDQPAPAPRRGWLARLLDRATLA
jgi:hypothetical protein